jgi:fructoselysine 6-kinase
MGRLVSAATRHRLRLSYDLAVYTGLPRLNGLEIAFASHEVTGQSPLDRAHSIVALGARLCVVTCGAEGSVAFDGMHVFSSQAVPVDVVDTTGAGDSYIAAFLAAYARGGSIVACMEAGSRAGAETCRFAGPWPGSLQVSSDCTRNGVAHG